MEVSWAQRCRTTQTHERNPLPSFIATGRHERIPPSRHSSQRAATNTFPLPSFPRRRESGCAIHEPFCECIQ